MQDKAAAKNDPDTASDRVRADDALRECEQTLRAVQQLARIGIWRYNVLEEALWWSDELYRIFCIDPATSRLSPQLVLERVHPDDRETFQRQMASGLPHHSDYRIMLPDGAVKYIHEEVHAERDASGTLVRMHGTAQDITERKRVEDALRASEGRYRTIVDSQAEFVVRYQAGRDHHLRERHPLQVHKHETRGPAREVLLSLHTSR